MAYIFDIKRFAINDGPGIRTTVFLKGCPLRCVWCHNPEGLSPRPVKMYNKKKCIGCQSCVDVCPNGALQLTADGIVATGHECVLCGKCTDECPTLALEMSGKEWSMDKLMTVLEKERHVMEQSGGGVTICGGEPLLSHQYLVELLDECGRRGFHRTVDTTLYSTAEVVRQVADRCELFLVDLKHMDSAKHKQYTGVENERILSNIRMIAESGKDFIIRIPLIDGFNSDVANIEASARFLSSLPWTRKEVNLLPYHDIGVGKHERMGTRYNPDDIRLETPDEETQKRCLEIFANHGIKAKIGG